MKYDFNETYTNGFVWMAANYSQDFDWYTDFNNKKSCVC